MHIYIYYVYLSVNTPAKPGTEICCIVSCLCVNRLSGVSVCIHYIYIIYMYVYIYIYIYDTYVYMYIHIYMYVCFTAYMYVYYCIASCLHVNRLSSESVLRCVKYIHIIYIYTHIYFIYTDLLLHCVLLIFE